MAIYQYECRACGEQFEITARMSEHNQLKQAPPACPACGKPDTHELVALFSCKPPSG